MGRSCVSGRTIRVPVLLRVLLGALLLTCVLSPWAYEVVLATWRDPPPPFGRVFDRVAMVGLLVMIVIERKKLDLAPVRACLVRERFGGSAGSFLRGLILSFFCGAAVGPLLLLQPGVTRSGMGAATLASRFCTDIPGALFVGLIEECFFRVIVLETARRALSTAPAIAITTLFYAGVHFLQPARDFVYQFTPLAGVYYFSAVAQRAFTFDFALPFVSLTLGGTVLALAIVRTGSLWLCIGLHAGWFLALKLGIRALDTSATGVPGMDVDRWSMLSTPWAWLSIAVVGGVVLVAPWRSAARAPTSQRSLETP